MKVATPSDNAGWLSSLYILKPTIPLAGSCSSNRIVVPGITMAVKRPCSRCNRDGSLLQQARIISRPAKAHVAVPCRIMSGSPDPMAI